MPDVTTIMLSLAALSVSTLAARHPLDPLLAEEITAAVAVVRADSRCAAGSHFPCVVLQEPAKAAVLAFDAGTQPAPAREALVVVYDPRKPMAADVIVGLSSNRVMSWRDRPGAQPFLMAHEYEAAPKLLKADERYKSALAKRGINDPAGVFIDVWAPGPVDAYLTDKSRPEPRLVRGLSFLQADGRNPYARPIEGLVGVVDLTSNRVVEVSDAGVTPIPADPCNYSDGPPAAESTRPSQSAIEVDGHGIRWKQWRFRYAITPREGLVLHRVAYDDNGRVRPVVYRASLSELVVPYGEASPAWTWRSAFDEGEYGLGKSAGPLKAGHDVPAGATVLDATFADDAGKPFVLERAAALYEVDGGVLWRHYDFVSQTTQSRRGRELWMTFWTAIGNYDYGFHWIFREDGSIEARVQLSGILLGKGTSLTACSSCASQPAASRTDAAEDRQARLIAANLAAPNHQHFLNFRLDLDVDGPRNRLVEQNVLPESPGAGNPGHNAFSAEYTILRSESAAQRDHDARAHRTWKVQNPGAPGPTGHSPSFGLHFADATPPFAASGAHFRRAGAFVEHAVWATRYNDAQRFAGGDYPNLADSNDGLRAWSRDNESIDNEDLVLWCTVGLTHVARPEEWPIMPAAHTGLRLAPDGFFRANPSLSP